MIRTIVICALIALVLVPATVLAAGPGQQNAGTITCQGNCLQDGQSCGNASAHNGPGTQGQFQHGMNQNGETRGFAAGDGLCTHDQKHTRTMSRLHDGSGPRYGNMTAAGQ